MGLLVQMLPSDYKISKRCKFYIFISFGILKLHLLLWSVCVTSIWTSILLLGNAKLTDHPLLFVNRFRYINNNVTEDRCPIPMDTTVRLGPLKFSLRAAIDHHGPSIHSGHYTASINCCNNKNSIATITQSRSLELLITKTPLLHMLYYMNWLTLDFWTRTGGWEFDRSHGAGTSSPSHWQQVEEQAPKPVGWMMCFLLMTLVPVQKLC